METAQPQRRLVAVAGREARGREQLRDLCRVDAEAGRGPLRCRAGDGEAYCDRHPHPGLGRDLSRRLELVTVVDHDQGARPRAELEQAARLHSGGDDDAIAVDAAVEHLLQLLLGGDVDSRTELDGTVDEAERLVRLAGEVDAEIDTVGARGPAQLGDVAGHRPRVDQVEGRSVLGDQLLQEPGPLEQPQLPGLGARGQRRDPAQ